jgi:DmsE family decaheme c-type cytochrome
MIKIARQWIKESAILVLIVFPVTVLSQSDTAIPTTICLTCHNMAPVNLILQTAHGARTNPASPLANQGCQACHGSGLDHVQGVQVDGKRVPPEVTFSNTTHDLANIDKGNQVCLGCHTSSDTSKWHGSEHQFADLSCTSCHDIHSLKDTVLDRFAQAEVCETCHVEQRAQSSLPHRHPIREGKMNCTDCHSPHGGPGPSMLAKNTVNGACYQCHEDKRGPFLWEHQPVREDCTLCHEPHGATQARMLKVRMPYLCNTCHSENFHPSSLNSGTGLAVSGASDDLLMRSCSNCHSKVHGSNHPSGTGLTR